jgi:hypothetical protein
MNTLPPLWLVEYARQLRKRGVSVYEAPRYFIRESRQRIDSGDLETAVWESSVAADDGMAAILSMWTGVS